MTILRPPYKPVYGVSIALANASNEESTSRIGSNMWKGFQDVNFSGEVIINNNWNTGNIGTIVEELSKNKSFISMIYTPNWGYIS